MNKSDQIKMREVVDVCNTYEQFREYIQSSNKYPATWWTGFPEIRLSSFYHIHKRFPDLKLDSERYTILWPEKEKLSELVKGIYGYPMCNRKDGKFGAPDSLKKATKEKELLYFSTLHQQELFEEKESCHFYIEPVFDFVKGTFWEGCLKNTSVGFQVAQNTYTIFGADGIAQFPIAIVEFDVTPVIYE